MQNYQQHGLRFAYPKDWVLEENNWGSPEGNLALSNEWGAFWTLQKNPAGTNPEEIIWEVVATMQSEYADIECNRFEQMIAGTSVIGFEMTFFYLDLMNLATVLCFEQGKQLFTVFWQTGNQLVIVDDLTVPIEKTMEAITHSLLEGFLA